MRPPAAPGGPRAAGPGGHEVTLGFVVALLWFSPLALLLAPLAGYLIARQTRWHWWRVAVAAAAAIAAVLAVSGPWPAVCRHFFVASHLWQYVALWLGYGGQAARPTLAGILRDLLVTQVWLAVPVAVLVGAFLLRRAERAAGGAEWSVYAQRRQRVDQRTVARRLRRVLARPRDGRCDAPALGVLHEGDLHEWVQRRRYVVVPRQLRGLGMVVVGAPGSGKTVTLTRLVFLAAQAGRKVGFADCKGTDPGLPAAVVAAYLAGNPAARVGLWPAMPLDGWRGTPEQVASRLLQVQAYTEPYYREAAGLAVRLALTPGPAVASSGAFLERLDAKWLEDAWRGDELRLRQVKAISDALPGVSLRYANYFATVAGGFDGAWSFEDADLAVLTVPSLASKDHADATVRMVLADWRHYAAVRKPRVGEDALLIVDEFGAIDGGPALATDLLERARDVGGSVVVAGQSAQSLGRDEWEARRLLGACAGGVIVHRCPDPDELLRAAGTVRQTEQSWQLDEAGASGLGNVRMGHKMKVSPDQVRQAGVGEAWVVHAGRAAHLQVLTAPAAAVAPGAWEAQEAAQGRVWADVRRADRARVKLAVAAAVRERDPAKAAALREVLAELPAAGGRAPLELAPASQPSRGRWRLPSVALVRVVLVALLRRWAARSRQL